MFTVVSSIGKIVVLQLRIFGAGKKCMAQVLEQVDTIQEIDLTT